MLPTFLAAAIAVMPTTETELRYSVWRNQLPLSGPGILAEKWRIDAVDLRDADKPADALPLFNAVLMLQPDNALARVGRAKTFAALGRYDEQADEYAWVLARNPCSPSTWQDIAEGWIARQKWAEAEQCFARALELSAPGEQRCWTLLNEASCWLGIDLSAAPKPDEFKHLPTARVVRGHVALSTAVEHAKEAGPATRQSAHALRAWFHVISGHYVEAAADYDRVLALAPNDGGVHFMRASVAFGLNDHNTALAHALLAERNGFNHAQATQLRCKCLLPLGRDDEAEAAAEQWCRIDPQDADAALYRAITLRVAGKHDEADGATARAAELSDRSFVIQAWAEMWALWVWYERLEEADRLLTHLLVGRTLTRSERALMHFCRGDLRRQLRSDEDGFHDLTAALRLAPSYHEARKLRAGLALKMKRHEIVVEDAEALTRITPFDPDAHKLLADARMAIRMSADLAGREPDFRPAGPLFAVPSVHSYGRALIDTYLPNR
jgi:tetratricopeptide (TPR) repeat protein